jgi:hypothetical protein
MDYTVFGVFAVECGEGRTRLGNLCCVCSENEGDYPGRATP